MKRMFVYFILIVPIMLFAQDDSLKKGIDLFNQGHYEDSKEFFQAEVEANNTNGQAYYYLGRSECFLKNFDEAEKNLKMAIELDKSNSTYYHGLGENYLLKLQNSSFFEKGILSGKVLDNYKKAVKIDPSNVEARISLANYYINAPSIGGGSISKAKEQILQIEKYNPEQAIMLMARIYIQEEDYNKAIEEFRKYLDNNPDDTDILYQLGMLYQKTTEYKKAFESFEQAVTIDPEAHESLYQIGRTAIFCEENLDRGIQAMKGYILSDPGPPNPSMDAAHWRLGMLYELKGKNNKAITEYKLALEANPEEQKYRDAIRNLD